MAHINRISKIDSYVKKLSQTDDKWVSLAIAVDITDEIMKGILPDKNGWHKKLTHNSQENAVLPDPLPLDIFKTQKQETWFVGHPVLGSARVALSHFNDEQSPLESHLYWFSEKQTKQKISVATQFTSNWEDSNLTRNDNYKVAIDFFLSHDTNTLMMVLTNKQKLRVMEFNGLLSNTQKQILSDKLFTIPNMEKEGYKSSQEHVHTYLWNAFQLKEVNNKFYQGISSLYNVLVQHLHTENDISIQDSKQYSSRLLSRLLFIWFLRKMNLINEDMSYFDTKAFNSSDYYEKYLKPLFFHTLNKPIEERNVTIQDETTPYLNGGLFDIKDNDFYDQKLRFPTKYFEKLYAHFNEFNFTVDESSIDYELVAVDPEMLGQIFESLLASQNEDDDISERKKTGSYYTPRHIVDYMCKESIRQYLYREIDNSKYEKGIDDLIDMTDAKFVERKSSSTMDLWGTNTNTVVSKIKRALDNVKIIDPAVGSGAFPMGMLQIMSKLYERIFPASQFNGYEVKLRIIENSIFGVDIQPMAIEIARLRAWLAIVVDDYHDNNKVNPLPNLEFKFVSANSLVDLETQGEIWADTELENKLSEIRQKYFRATTTKSKNKWQKKYYDTTQQTELFEDKRNKQLKTFDPFNNVSSATFYDSEFMFGISDGFDIAIGNPPYIMFEKMNIKEREFIKTLNYKTHASQGGNIYTLFYEHGANLLSEGGILTYITSNKWMRAGYGRKLRNFLISETNPSILIDLGEGVFDHATVDTNILIFSKETYEESTIGLSLEDKDIQTSILDHSVIMKYKQNEPWTILNAIEQSIKEKIKSVGTPLKDWNIQIRRGLLTGLNSAFIISGDTREELIAKDPKSKKIIRPLLRGRDIKENALNFSEKYLINSHNGYIDSEGKYIKRIEIDEYTAIKGHLNQFEPKLSSRSDQGDTPYNLRGVAYMNEFNERKIIYPETTQGAYFQLDTDKYIIDKTAYMITGENLKYLQRTLSSNLFEFAYKEIFAVIQLGKNGYQYNKYGLEQLPVLKTNEVPELNNEDDIFNLYKLSNEEKVYIKNKLG